MQDNININGVLNPNRNFNPTTGLVELCELVSWVVELGHINALYYALINMY